jgi:hypothetical protein
MSHDGIWRAACFITIRTTPFHFEMDYVARGVTDVGVGSGALLGLLSELCETRCIQANDETKHQPAREEHHT